MKKNMKTIHQLMLLSLILVANITSCKSGGESQSSKTRKPDNISMITSNVNGTGKTIEIEMIKGKAHNHPTFAIWLEDTSGKYLQTLFVTKALGQGIYAHGDKSGGTWKPGEVRRPASLPYWAHKWNVKNEYGSYVPTPKNKVVDAYTGATPAGSFRLSTRPDIVLSGKVLIFMEINQAWDWNEYWTNALYPYDTDYQSSCQPAVVYSALVDMEKPGSVIEMKPVGHSHYSGNTGELFTDLSSITTALHIAEQVRVTIK
jgi:hypothetical protein